MKGIVTMTWGELLERLDDMDEPVLNQTATVYLSVTDEYIEISDLDVTVESDIMDDGQVIAVVDF